MLIVLRRNSASVVVLAVVVGLAAACGGQGSRPTATTPKRISRTFMSIGDAYVRKSQPRAKFGKTSELRLDASPPARAYLRFRPLGITGKIERATLRIYTLTASNDGFEVRSTSGGWSESRITFANAPPVGNVVGVSASFARQSWRSIDVSSLVHSRTGLVEVALTGPDPTELALASRERGELAPRLIIESTR